MDEYFLVNSFFGRKADMSSLYFILDRDRTDNEMATARMIQATVLRDDRKSYIFRKNRFICV